MADDLKIRAGADTGDFETGMARIQKVAAKTEGSLENLAKEAKVAGNAITAINSPANATSAALAKTAVSANKMDSALGKGAKGGAQATFALINLGRVAEDVPFGFVGIANNLNPLLESFQRLKAESGSTGGALKALGSSLMGAGGLGLALSALTAVMTFAQIGFTAWTRGLDAAKKKADESKDSLKAINESIAQEETRVISLIAVLKNEAETRERKLAALKELKQINPEIFNQLKLEGNAVNDLDAAYRTYLENIKTVVAVKIKQAQLEGEITKLLALQNKTLVGRERIAYNIQQGMEELIRKADSLQGGQGAAAKLLLENTLARLKKEKEIAAVEEEIKLLMSDITELSKGIKISNNGNEDIFDDKKNKKKVGSISDVLSDLAKEIDFLNSKSLVFGTSEVENKIKAIQQSAEKILKEFNVPPDDAIINKLLYGGKMQNIKGFKIPGANSLENQIKELLKTSISRPVDVTIPVLPTFEFKPIDTDAFLKALRAQELNEGITSIFSSLSQTIVDGFGDMLTSIASFGNVGNAFGGFFKGILNSLGTMVQQLGKETLLVQFLIKKLKDLFGSSAGIGASLGLIALGAVIKGIAARISVPKFADGVDYFRGGLALVGERGPELVNLPTGSGVVPNYALKSDISGAGSIEVTGNIVARGSDLVVIFDRANRSLNRIG